MLILAQYKDDNAINDTHLTMSEANDKGFQSVGRTFDAKLTDAQIVALKKELGTNTVNIKKCTEVYTLMQEGKTNSEIERMNIYKSRVLATIRATLFPTKKNTTKTLQNVVHF
jgi:hypothetical protein